MISGLRNPSIFACTGNFRVLWRSNVRNCVSVFTHDTRCQVCRCAWRFRRCLRIRTLRDIGRRRDVRRRGDIGRCGLRIGNDISVCHISADRAAVSFYSDFLYLIVDFVSVPVAKLRKVREAGFPFVLIGEGQAVFFYTVCKEKDFYLIGTFPNPTLFYEKGPSGNIFHLEALCQTAAYETGIAIQRTLFHEILVWLPIFILFREIFEAKLPFVGSRVFLHDFRTDIKRIVRVGLALPIEFYGDAFRSSCRVVVVPSFNDLDFRQIPFAHIDISVGADAAAAGCGIVSGNPYRGKTFRCTVFLHRAP